MLFSLSFLIGHLESWLPPFELKSGEERKKINFIQSLNVYRIEIKAK